MALMRTDTPALPWLAPGQPFPPAGDAWGARTPAPGLLAAGGSLDVNSLFSAYQAGIFPWFSAGDPILWWSPDPRMVLDPRQFKLHTSLRKTVQKFLRHTQCEIRVDSAFDRVITACATTPRSRQTGTWIVSDMVHAYLALHEQGHAHSVETWVHGQLVGGLYLVNVGQAVFGESMFSWQSDASKIALAALVAKCRFDGIRLIDCQQNTRHLGSLGAGEIARADFLAHLARSTPLPCPAWHFDPIYWDALFANSPGSP